MTRVYIADAKPEERYALRLLLIDLNMEVVGESADWFAMLTQAPSTRADMLLVDWDLIPSLSDIALKELHRACPAALIIVIISYLDANLHAALSPGVDVLISKGEAPERIADRLRLAAVSVPSITHLAE